MVGCALHDVAYEVYVCVPMRCTFGLLDGFVEAHIWG